MVSATEMKTVVNEQTIGDSMFNSNLASVHVQAEDGATVDSIDIIDNSGGTVITPVRWCSWWFQVVPMSLEYNLKVDGMALPIGKGFRPQGEHDLSMRRLSWGMKSIGTPRRGISD